MANVHLGSMHVLGLSTSRSGVSTDAVEARLWVTGHPGGDAIRLALQFNWLEHTTFCLTQ